MGSGEQSADPDLGVLHIAGEGLWFAKSLFVPGKGSGKLQTEAIRQRLLMGLGEDPAKHESLSPANGDLQQDSTVTQLDEERALLQELLAAHKRIQSMPARGRPLAESVPIWLDTTMTVATCGGEGEGSDKPLLVRSPIALTRKLREQVDAKGSVKYIAAVSLQHWLFVEEWADAYPNASILQTSPAFGESIKEKLPDRLRNRVQLMELPCENVPANSKHVVTTSQCPLLEWRMLRGAPLMMNEIVFYHKPSKALIVDDAFYGGYSNATKSFTTPATAELGAKTRGLYGVSTPTPFGRMWFKVTKGGWMRSGLPIYRTARVHSHGDAEELLESISDMVKSWSIDKIVFAHGSGLYSPAFDRDHGSDVGEEFLQHWRDGITEGSRCG